MNCKNFFIGFFLMLLLQISIQAQTTVTIYSSSVTSIVRYIDENNQYSFDYSSIAQIGRKDGSNNIYSGSTEDIYRSEYHFELGTIPSNATLTQVKLLYFVTGNCSTCKFKVTQTTGTKAYGNLWNEIGTSTIKESNLEYTNSSIISSSLLSAVDASRANGSIYLGALSQNESSNLTDATVELRLEVTYNVPPSVVTFQAKNIFESGKIGVSLNNDPIDPNASSPYTFSSITVGTQVNLEAQEQNYGGYSRIWNDNEAPLNKSKWVKHDAQGGQTNKSMTINYSFTAAEDDDNSIYEAGLRRNYKITQNEDFSEFDNLIANTETTYIVEQNSGAISAPSTKTVNERTYTFTGWADANTDNPRTINPIDNETYTALYKYKFHSNDIYAYSNNGQRKVVKTSDGVLHAVYESMGKIWYELSTDNGQSWTLMNINYSFNNGGNSKNPTIANYLNNVLIAYQADVNGYTEIKVELFQKDSYSNNYYHADNLSIQEEIPGLSWVYSTDFVPVIEVGAYNFLVAFNTNGSIIYRLGGLDVYNNNIWWRNDKRSISGTNASDYNLSIASLYGNTYHLGWQYSQSSIRYCSLTLGSNNEMTVSSIETVSSGSGYTKNYYPSITVMDNDVVRVGWVGYRFVPGISKSSGEKVLGTYEYRAVMRERTASGWNGTFYKLGANVETININRSEDNNSVFCRVEGSSNPIVKYIINKNTIYQTITNPGNYVQISNGVDLTNMKAIAYSTATSPYSFLVSSISSAAKTNSSAYSTGREGIISKNGAEFYLVIGDVTLDGNNVAFNKLTKPVNEENYFTYLESDKINVNDKSALTYSVLYGFVDSLKVAELLTEDKGVNFRVELVDGNTDEVLGIYDNVTYNSGNLYQYDNIAYYLDMKGIGSREVKLRLRIEENIGGKYTLADITAEEALLPKTSVKELSYQGELAVKEYALQQNYPNPFNPSTTIKYQLPKNGNVKLVIYDMLGREVKTLVNGFKQKGRYEVRFDASRLSSGVYIYRLESRGTTLSRKMILLK